MAKISVQAYYQTAISMHQSGKLHQARKLYSDILRLKPNHFESLFMIGQSWFQQKEYEKALDYYDKCILLNKSNSDLLLQRARTLTQLKKFEEANSAFERLVNSNGSSVRVLFHAARNMKEAGDFERAISIYKRLLKLDPEHKQALNNLGNLYQKVHDYTKSLESYDKCIKIDNQFPMTYCNKAGLLQKTGNIEEAEKLYFKTLELDNTSALAYYNLGIIESTRYNYNKATGLLNKAIRLNPGNHKYISTYASTLYSLGKKSQALEILKSLVLERSPSEEPYLKLAKIWMVESEKSKVVELLESYLKKNPNAFEYYYLLGVAHEQLNSFEKAEAALTKIEDHPELALRTLMTLQLLYPKIGKFDRYEEIMIKVSNQLEKFVSNDRLEDEIPVYNLAYFPFDPDLVAQTTAKFSAALSARVAPLRSRLNFDYQPKKEKIKIAYLSPYFNNHPAGILIQGTLEGHDRNKFEVHGYAINCKEDDANLKIQSLLDYYTDLGDLSTQEAAEKINNDGINILISLAGYNNGMRSEIPALRPAPIQVVAMDCHESMQSDFYDYVFKDEEVLTDENRRFFSEAIVSLPPSHFFNVELKASDKKPKRADYDLPEDVFVFGCLNHPRKLSPLAMQVWMEIVKEVPNSILWLYDAGFDSFRSNIRQIVKDHPIDPQRIIFCGREPYKDHYARMQLIDLFLDTPIYNGHTTCLEALWMEVPILTLRGKSVSSRLCSSFLSALEMEEMICDKPESYVSKAINIAINEKEFKKIKGQLKAAKENSSFFDTHLLVKRMEKAYEEMWSKYEKGESVTDFKVV